MSKPKIDLVKFRGEYFPLDEDSYNTLVEYKVNVFRIPPHTLEILKSTLLKSVKIHIQPWSVIYPQLVKRFLSVLPKEGVATKANDNWILVGIDLDFNQDEIKEIERYVTLRCGQLQNLVGRYGLRMSTQSKDKNGYRMVKLTFTPDESIVPAFYFGVSPKSPIEKLFYLSDSCRVVFTRKESIEGQSLICVAFEDKLGSDWSQTVVRSFPINKVPLSSIEEMLSFFTNLHATSKPVRNN